MNNQQKLVQPFVQVTQEQSNNEAVRLASMPKGELTKSPEVKEYLVLMQYRETGENDYKFIMGRTETYKFIKDIIDELDIDESFVIVETVNISSRITVYEFMRMCKERKLFDDDFDIDQYA